MIERGYVALVCFQPTPCSIDSFLGSVEHLDPQVQTSKNYCVYAKAESNIIIFNIFMYIFIYIYCISEK